jgi:DnaJ-class molecular chaperone
MEVMPKILPKMLKFHNLNSIADDKMPDRKVRVDIHHHKDKSSAKDSDRGEIVDCAACKGTGRAGMWQQNICPVCKGKGKVRV